VGNGHGRIKGSLVHFLRLGFAIGHCGVARHALILNEDLHGFRG
jgi:hypothetical protein